MALMKLVAQHRLDTLQLGLRDHLPHQHPFRDKTDPRPGRCQVIQPDGVAHFPAQLRLPLLRHPLGQHPCRQPPRLQNHGLPRGPQTPPVQQHLRDLGGLPGPGGRLDHHPPFARPDCLQQRSPDLLDRQTRHHATILPFRFVMVIVNVKDNSLSAIS